VSVKKFLLLWGINTIGILVYAVVDLLANPQIQLETELSIQPDVSRLPSLLHWGGRLIHHDMGGLLFLNAVFIGGLLALVVSWVRGVFTSSS
jgi:hypothetical protein